MAKRQSKFLVRQKIAVGVFGALVVIAALFLLWQSQQVTPTGEFVEGRDYVLVENPRRIRSDRIEIMEFFSYGCIHCYNFDPILTDWVEEKGETIEFLRAPAIASDYWRLLGRVYFALEQMDVLEEQHLPFFRAIHDGRRLFNSEAEVLDYFESAGLDRATFARALASPEVSSQLVRSDQMARRLRVAAVPTIVVQGKYIVRATTSIGPRQMLLVMDHLIEKESVPAGGN